MTFIKTLPINEAGRDFVVGDLHGQAHLLQTFLSFIQFDRTKDRMISVGDLVDRGEFNVECLELLDKPWFHAVRGNHEQLMLDHMFGGPSGDWWFPNGGNWFWNITPDEQAWVKDIVSRKVQDLPWLLNVPMRDGRFFHVLHAELAETSTITLEDMLSEAMFADMAIVPSFDGETCIWGRNIFREMFAKVLDGRQVHKLARGLELDKALDMFKGSDIGNIFSGHTPVTRPTQAGKQINIDTMAFNVGKRPWCGLTFAEPATGKFWTVSDDVKDAELLVIV